MKKLVLLGLFGFIFFIFNSNEVVGATTAICQTVDTTNSYYNLSTSFAKYDGKMTFAKGPTTEETTEINPVEGAEFTFTSIDESYAFETNQTYENNEYGLVAYKTVQASELYKILPPTIKNIYDNINTVEDFNNFMNESAFNTYTNGCRRWCKSEEECYRKSYVLEFDIPIRIKENVTPDGYLKKDFVMIVSTRIFFNYKDDEDTVDNKQIVIENVIRKSLGDSYYEYDPSVNYYDYIVDRHSLDNFISASDFESYHGYIYNEKEPAKLKIENFIEGKYTYDTTSNTRVSYKITVSNVGALTSYQNNIEISVPKKLKVDASSISNEGLYDEEENTVVWRVEEIEGKANVDLYFDIIVPQEVKGEYKLGSKVSNKDESVEAEKNTLNVSAPLENPKTGDTNQLIILISLTVISTIAYLIMNKKTILSN